MFIVLLIISFFLLSGGLCLFFIIVIGVYFLLSRLLAFTIGHLLVFDLLSLSIRFVLLILFVRLGDLAGFVSILLSVSWLFALFLFVGFLNDYLLGHGFALLCCLGASPSLVVVLGCSGLLLLFRWQKTHLDGLGTGHSDLDLLRGAGVAQGSVGLEDVPVLALDALAWLRQRLVLLVVDLPLDLIVASLAQVVQWRLHDTLRQLTLIIQLELGHVLMFLTALLLVGHRHVCRRFISSKSVMGWLIILILINHRDGAVVRGSGALDQASGRDSGAGAA